MLLATSTCIRTTAGWIEALLMETMIECIHKRDQQPRSARTYVTDRQTDRHSAPAKCGVCCDAIYITSNVWYYTAL